MSLKLNLKSTLLGAALVLSGALAADELPGLISFVFKAGEPIHSAEVNANFARLGTVVAVLQDTATQPIPTERLAVGSVTAGKLQSRTSPTDGQVLGSEGGQLTWKKVSTLNRIYETTAFHGVPVPGDVAKSFAAQCASPTHIAIGGSFIYRGGENQQYLHQVASYPSQPSEWMISLGNSYGSAKSIIYVDVRVMCVQP